MEEKTFSMGRGQCLVVGMMDGCPVLQAGAVGGNSSWDKDFLRIVSILSNKGFFKGQTPSSWYSTLFSSALPLGRKDHDFHRCFAGCDYDHPGS